MHAGSPNPSQTEWVRPEPERRRYPRAVPGTASYAVGDTVSGHVAELNEILNISEDGIGIQALWPLTVGHEADFRLDLSNPSTYVEVKGIVVWSEQAGRAGIRFTRIPETGRRELETWLSARGVGSLIDSSTDPPAVPLFEEPEPNDALLCEIVAAEEDTPRNADYTSLLAALDAIRREAQSLGNDLDAALQLIANRAQIFTRASGVAIALSGGPEMTCRATAGNDSPPVGARLQIGSGFSGECVRTGALLHCRDAETDPLVDRESCQVLGIRSIVAVPIRAADQVIGLLEVFSPQANNFGADDEVVLQRLALIISSTIRRASQGEASPRQDANVDDEFPVETSADLPIPQFSPSRNGLLISAAITVVIAVCWLIGTWDSHSKGSTLSQPMLPPATIAQPSTQASLNDLAGLRRLAEQGDSVAQFAVGTRYATGQDVPQDYAQATRWFTQAAEQGSVIAQATLAAYYSTGRGVPQDPSKAYFWSLIAQAGGDEASKSRATALEPLLTPGRVAEERQEAEKWLKQHLVAAKDSAPTPTH
ncbi:MAG TPA: GAF domain-containing protein [Terriglobales bacterium]|nr:GAF domain-containing protein [Terriglobales bacterium]